MIEVVGVSQHYGVRPVLTDINVAINAGALTAIVGPNGMGKSTLLSVLAGILAPQKGYVEIAGIRRRSSEKGELAIRRMVCYLPDHPWLPMRRTGREYLLGVGRLYDVDDDRLMSHVDQLLEVFDLVREGWRVRSGRRKRDLGDAVAFDPRQWQAKSFLLAPDRRTPINADARTPYAAGFPEDLRRCNTACSEWGSPGRPSSAILALDHSPSLRVRFLGEV